jgi:uncharacterized membrane protein (DUF4010 family)
MVLLTTGVMGGAVTALDDATVTETLGRLGVALAAGLLVGMQRQYAGQSAVHQENGRQENGRQENGRQENGRHVDADGGHDRSDGAPQGADLFAGARSFSLSAVLGALASVVAAELDSIAVLVAAFAALGAVVAFGYAAMARRGDVGMTTEVAILVTFLAGALAGVGELLLAAAVSVGTTAVLAIKPYTRAFAARIDERDVLATLQFAVLAALVLPVLPRDPIGDAPFDAASPFNVGLMVVFILGLSFLGYVSIKTVGARRGIGLTGVLGGLVSSTAVTLTMAERSKHSAGLLRPLSMAVLVAWAIMYGRVLVEVGVVEASLLSTVALPIALGGMVILAWAGWLTWRDRDGAEGAAEGSFTNPFSVGPAIKFGLLYGAVLIGSKALSMYVGDAGVYVGAVVSGLADVDAITLSMAELNGDGTLSDDTAATAIVLAASSNTIVKGALVWITAAPAMRRLVLPAVVGSPLVALAAVLAVRAG